MTVVMPPTVPCWALAYHSFARLCVYAACVLDLPAVIVLQTL